MNSGVFVIQREGMWTIRWMTRGRGLALTLLFTGLAAFEIVATTSSGRADGLQYGLILDLAISLELCAIAFGVIAWLFLFWRRSLAFFRPERLPDILLAPLSPREVWPALLGAPTVLAMGLAAIWEVLVLGLPHAMGDHYYLLRLYLLPVSSMTPENLGWIQLMTWLRAPLMVIEAGTLALTSAAAGAYFVLPKGGSLRLVLVLAVFQVLVVPEILLSLWIDDRSVLSGTVAHPRQLFCDHIAGPLMTIALSWTVFRILLGLLRGKNFWNRLREEAAKFG